jgi:hypothetical protein
MQAVADNRGCLQTKGRWEAENPKTRGAPLLAITAEGAEGHRAFKSVWYGAGERRIATLVDTQPFGEPQPPIAVSRLQER